MKNTRLLHRGSREYKRIFNLLKNLKNAWLNSDLVIQGKQKPVIFVDRDLIGELLFLVDELKEVEKVAAKAPIIKTTIIQGPTLKVKIPAISPITARPSTGLGYIQTAAKRRKIVATMNEAT